MGKLSTREALFNKIEEASTELQEDILLQESLNDCRNILNSTHDNDLQTADLAIEITLAWKRSMVRHERELEQEQEQERQKNPFYRLSSILGSHIHFNRKHSSEDRAIAR